MDMFLAKSHLKENSLNLGLSIRELEIQLEQLIIRTNSKRDQMVPSK